MSVLLGLPHNYTPLRRFLLFPDCLAHEDREAIAGYLIAAYGAVNAMKVAGRMAGRYIRQSVAAGAYLLAGVAAGTAVLTTQ